MNIAFWSNEENSGITSNMLALGTSIALGYQERIIMLENHRSRNNLAKGLFGAYTAEFVREDGNYYYMNGKADHVIKRFSNKMNRKLIDLIAIEVLENSLYYYWQDHLITPELFDYQFFSDYYLILEQAGLIGRLSFLDTKPHNTLSTKEILDMAELVVINLKQDPVSVQSFFQKYQSIIYKSIFIISKYRENDGVNPDYLVNKFGVNRDQIGVIPRCGGFKAAVEEGRTLEFISSNYNCKEETDYWYFISALRNASSIVMQNILNYETKGRPSC